MVAFKMSTSFEQKLAIKSGMHALVIGGSMAGLLAARVLANHFDRVTIVERDRTRHLVMAQPGVGSLPKLVERPRTYPVTTAFR